MSSVKGHTLQTNVEQKKLVQKRLERISVLSSENSRLFFFHVFVYFCASCKMANVVLTYVLSILEMGLRKWVDKFLMTGKGIT